MTTWSFVQMSALILLVGAVLGATGAGVLVPATAEGRGRLKPDARRRRLVLWALAPMISGLVLLGATLAPGFFHQVGWLADHCHSHGHHFHVCPVHGFHGPHTPLLWLPVAAVAVWTTWHLGRVLIDWRRTLRRLSGLEATWDGELQAYRVEADRAFAFSGGLLRPKTYVSEGLVSRLEPTQLRVVLAHEAAHTARRHAIIREVVSWASRLHLPATRRRLLEEFELACEQESDDAAARRVNDPVVVAETILEMGRMNRAAGAEPLSASRFAGSVLESRVRGLLEADWREPRTLGFGLTLVGIGALAMWTSPTIHHTVETLLGWIV